MQRKEKRKKGAWDGLQEAVNEHLPSSKETGGHLRGRVRCWGLVVIGSPGCKSDEITP